MMITFHIIRRARLCLTYRSREDGGVDVIRVVEQPVLVIGDGVEGSGWWRLRACLFASKLATIQPLRASALEPRINAMRWIGIYLLWPLWYLILPTYSGNRWEQLFLTVYVIGSVLFFAFLVNAVRIRTQEHQIREKVIFTWLLRLYPIYSPWVFWVAFYNLLLPRST